LMSIKCCPTFANAQHGIRIYIYAYTYFTPVLSGCFE
jgi:hypothetical protein